MSTCSPIEQRRILDHDAGPLRIAAGAGTGKTGTLQRAIVERIEAGASPGEILCLTFTVEATKEMRRRVLDALSDREGIDPDELTVQTYHAFAASIVREHAPLIGLDVRRGAARPGPPVAARARGARPLHVRPSSRSAGCRPSSARCSRSTRRCSGTSSRPTRCARGAPRSRPTRSRAIAPRPCRRSSATARSSSSAARSTSATRSRSRSSSCARGPRCSSGCARASASSSSTSTRTPTSPSASSSSSSPPTPSGRLRRRRRGPGDLRLARRDDPQHVRVRRTTSRARASRRCRRTSAPASGSSTWRTR